MVGIRHWLVAIAFAAAVQVAESAPKNYWVCVDANGIKSAQDRPCLDQDQTVKAPPGQQVKTIQPQESVAPPPIALPPEPAAQTFSPRQAVPQKQVRPPIAVDFSPLISNIVRSLMTVALLLVVVVALRVGISISRRKRRSLSSARLPASDRIEWQPPAMTPREKSAYSDQVGHM